MIELPWIVIAGAKGYLPPQFVPLEFRIEDGGQILNGTSGVLKSGVFEDIVRSDTVFVIDNGIDRQALNSRQVHSWRFVRESDARACRQI